MAAMLLRRYLGEMELPQTGKILVVAPDEVMRLSLCFVLEAEGYEVRLADSALGWETEMKSTDCVIIEDSALVSAKAAGVAFGPSPVIVLAERVEDAARFPGYELVQKPLLGQALIDLVQLAMRARRSAVLPAAK